MACPNCRRALRVRAEYLGKWITCKHCNRTFRADAPADDATRERLSRLEAELEKARAELASRAGTPAAIEIDVEATLAELTQLRDQARTLSEQADKLRRELAAQRQLADEERQAHAAAAERLQA